MAMLDDSYLKGPFGHDAARADTYQALVNLTHEIRDHRRVVDREIDRLREENARLSKDRTLYRAIAALALRALGGPTRTDESGAIIEQGMKVIVTDKTIRRLAREDEPYTPQAVTISAEFQPSLRAYEVVVTGPNLVSDAGEIQAEVLTDGYDLTTAYRL